MLNGTTTPTPARARPPGPLKRMLQRRVCNRLACSLLPLNLTKASPPFISRPYVRTTVTDINTAVHSSRMSEVKKRKLESTANPTNAALSDHTESAPRAQLQSSSSFKVTGLLVTDHMFRVPLDHSEQTPGDINLFVRELVAPVNVRRPQPYLLYLQGGPGFESPRVIEAAGWLKAAANNFRIILMDQRGTGRSQPVTVTNLKRHGTAEQQAHYLTFFRADSIVADAELVRKALVPHNGTTFDGKWSILGQSFGGFCALTYLSVAPHGLVEVLTTGGIPPGISDPCSADRVYSALFTRVLTQNKKYYSRFPADVSLVQRIVKYLAGQPEGGLRLASGTLLTPRAFQLLGLSGLGSGGGFERLHYLLEEFFDVDDQVNPAFIKGFEHWMSWDTNPLYALLHEAIYCQGAASNWSAHRIRQQHFAAEFDALTAAQHGQPVMFTGEMVFPWMFEDFAALRPYKETADVLAAKQDWPTLYKPEVLQENSVPLAAATYLEDMYVDYHLVQETLGQTAGVRQWVTNEYKHSGIRDDGNRILERLLNIVRDGILLE